MSHEELVKMIDTYIKSKRKKVKPRMPKYCKVNDIVFQWSDYTNKYFKGAEHHIESRLEVFLRRMDIDPEKVEYTLYD